MRRRQADDIYEQHSAPSSQSVPFGALWSALASELGGQYTIGSSPIASLEGGIATPSPALATMTTTAEVTVPVSTVIVESTVLRTSFVTVHVPTGVLEPATSTSASVSSSSTSSTALAFSLSSTTRPSSESSTSRHTTLPVLVTQSSTSSSPSLTLALQSNAPAAAPSATSSATSQGNHSSHKQAIIGGLSGAAAGLVLIGVLLCFAFRRRKIREEETETGSINEKGLRPAVVRKWTGMTGKGTPKPTPRILQPNSPVTVDEDHHIIRMSTHHWARPFAQGQGEGFRESVAPGQLRVVNPDLSRPTTPRMSSDTAGSFLKNQRSALAAVLMYANRSRKSSRSNIHQAAGGIPEITFDPALSRECIAPMARTPSFKSYPSINSVQLVSQQPPEDPFVTPPLETADPAAQQRPRRPSLAPLQSAAGAAGRTLSHIGSFLNPFRTPSHVAASEPTFSRHSVSTYSSRLSRGDTVLSDPFDLDRPSIRGSAVLGRTPGELGRGQMPNWHVYEGT